MPKPNNAPQVNIQRPWCIFGWNITCNLIIGLKITIFRKSIRYTIA